MTKKYMVYTLVLAILLNGCVAYDSHEYFGEKEPYFEICCEGNNGSIEGEDRS